MEVKKWQILLYFIFLFWMACPGHAQKKLSFQDASHESFIRTVQLYPNTNEPGAPLLPAVTNIQNQNLILEFDDLRENRANHYVRLIHCNYDWTQSQLRDLDYLTEYNEFTINDYAYSNNTPVHYVHYRFQIPRVKLPGNYLIMVYQNGNKNNLMLTRRMMVVSSRVRLTQDSQSMGSLTLRSTNQQINFTIDYNGVQLMNPMQNVHVVIRQNQRWDNAKKDVSPSFIREDQSQIEYLLFGDDKYFNAGNEFRFVDFRSLNYPGQNTGRLDRTTNPPHLWVQQDEPRTDKAYAQFRDLNGNYNIENLDYGEGNTTGNYLDVTFSLRTQSLYNSDIFVFGGMTNWTTASDTKMSYNESTGSYECTLLLKQGWYNYQYYVRSESYPPNYLEGNHFETENLYEVLFYYRSFQPNADQLLGYFPIRVNPR